MDYPLSESIVAVAVDEAHCVSKWHDSCHLNCLLGGTISIPTLSGHLSRINHVYVLRTIGVVPLDPSIPEWARLIRALLPSSGVSTAGPSRAQVLPFQLGALPCKRLIYVLENGISLFSIQLSGRY